MRMCTILPIKKVKISSEKNITIWYNSIPVPFITIFLGWIIKQIYHLLLGHLLIYSAVLYCHYLHPVRKCCLFGRLRSCREGVSPLFTKRIIKDFQLLGAGHIPQCVLSVTCCGPLLLASPGYWWNTQGTRTMPTHGLPYKIRRRPSILLQYTTVNSCDKGHVYSRQAKTCFSDGHITSIHHVSNIFGIFYTYFIRWMVQPPEESLVCL